jgi:GST-like protein
MIDFYYAPTPNGWKVAIMLGECGLQHRTILMHLTEGDQFKPEFLELSPNAKMPAILDHDAAGGPISVFESGAILFYLAEKVGRFMPTDPLGRKETLEWLFWQAGNQGPMGGQLSHFVNYAPKDQLYSQIRYAGEYERNLGVLERRLTGRDFILTDYSIADMMAFPWAFIAKPLGASLDVFPNVAAWRERIKNREAVRRAIDLYKHEQNRGEQNASNNDILFNQRARHVLNKSEVLPNNVAPSRSGLTS